MHISKSVSFDVELLKAVNRWAKIEGVSGVSTVIQILVQRGLTCSCYRKKGGRVGQQKLIARESNLKGDNEDLKHFFKNQAINNMR